MQLCKSEAERQVRRSFADLLLKLSKYFSNLSIMQQEHTRHTFKSLPTKSRQWAENLKRTSQQLWPVAAHSSFRSQFELEDDGSSAIEVPDQ